MTRLALLTLLSLAASGLSAMAPLGLQDDVQSMACLSDKWCWRDCGNREDPVHIKSIKISPDPPKPGEDLTVSVIGEATERVEDGAYADVVVKVGVIKLLQKEFDLCDEARNAQLNLTCPIEEGVYHVKHTVTLPKEIPPAPFKVNVDGYTIDDDPLLCLQLEIDFRKPRGGH